MFVQIVDRGSLSGAARALGVTKNAVTRCLARLEEQLDKPLMMRTTRHVSLTENGRQFHEHCLRILNEVTLAEDSLIDRDTLRGTLRVSIPTRLLMAHQLSLISDFLIDHPNLELQIIATDQPVDLLEQRIDVAIAVGPQPDSTLLQRRVASFGNFVLAATPSYVERCGRPKRLQDLKHHQCLKFQPDQPQRQWPLIDSSGTEHDVPVGGGFSSNDSRALDTAMHAGLGIGFVAKSVLRELKETGALVPILPKYRVAPFQVCLLYQRQAARSKRLDGLLNMLATLVREVMS